MLVLIPVYQFRVDYVVAHGRPFSSFEQLLLEELSSGPRGIEEIESTFLVHRRIVVESLVTLTLAGWVGVTENGVALTSAGKASLVDTEMRPRVRSSEHRTGYVLMEQISGVISSNRIRYTTSAALREAEVLDEAVRLRPDVFRKNLLDSDVDSLVFLRRGEWVERIQRVQLNRGQNIWVQVEIDRSSGRVSNRPPEWKHLDVDILRKLQSENDIEMRCTRLVDATGAAAGLSSQPRVDHLLARMRPIDASDCSVVSTSQQHLGVLRSALSQADSFVLVGSSFVRPSVVKELTADITEATARGVHVFFLRGYAGDEPAEASKCLKELRSKLAGHAGRFYTTGEHVGSHAKALIWNKGGRCYTCIGSFNWLSSKHWLSAGRAIDLSAVSSDPSLAARLLRFFSGLWSSSENSIATGAPQFLARLGTEQERNGAEEAELLEDVGTPLGAIVTDAEHLMLLRLAFDSARERLAIASHKFFEIGAKRTAGGISADVDYRVYYGEGYAEEGDQAEIVRIAEEAGATVLHTPHFHCKLVVWDDCVYTGSFNFLSAGVGSDSRGRELGVLIKDAEMADYAWNFLDELSGTDSMEPKNE